MTDREPQFISPAQLCVGLYVHLDVTWTRHPFALGNFKIKDQVQIFTIRNLGIEKIRYDPLRSDCEPLPLDSALPNLQPVPSEKSEAPARVAFLSERVKHVHRAIRECEKRFFYATTVARSALHKVVHNPRDGMTEAEVLVNEMVERAMLEDSAIVQYMDGGRFAEDSYLHPLNVTVLCLMMAKALKLSVEDARCLGMAALFHDIGKTEVPSGVLMNVDNLNRAESALLQQHAEYGAKLINKVKTSDADRIAKLIAQHHEYADGSGYPAGLKGTQIDYLAGILSLANSYEHLCNPHNIANAMTPYSALAHLFSTERKKHDSSLLNVFIKMLGIYPPGSVVILNDGNYGIVVSVNPQQLLRPVVMLHDKRMERDAPNILDLSEDEDVGIKQCIHASQLPSEVSDYLQCRQSLSYYFRTKQPAGEVVSA